MSNIELHIDSELARAREAYEAASGDWKLQAKLGKEYDALVLAKLAEVAGKPVGILEYSSNNSGGSWWVKDAGWKALADAGWVVHWGQRSYGALADLITPVEPTGATWLGALAMSAAKVGPDPQALVDEWERLTGCTASDRGCNCCGPPHSFEWHSPTGETVYPSVSVVEVWGGF